MAVLIAGGGLAGQLAALFLAQKGIETRLVDPHQNEQDRVCGEGILPLGWNELAKIDDGALKAEGWPIRGIEYKSGNRKILGRINREGLGIERGKLDHWLKSKIKQQPLIHREYRRIQANELKAGDVVATGTQSKLSTQLKLNLQKKRFYGHRFRIETARSCDFVSVYFDSWGEMYLTPIGQNRVSVALLCRKKGAPRNLEQAMQALSLKYPNLGATNPEEFASRSPIQCRPKNRPKRLFCLGDAYQTFDPISGAGMSFAIHSAACLARNWPGDSFSKEMVPIRRHFHRMTQLCLLLSGRPKLVRFFIAWMNRKPHRFEAMLRTYNDPFSSARICMSLLRALY